MYRSDKLVSCLLSLVLCTLSTGAVADVFSKRSENSLDANTISVVGDRVADWQIANLNDLGYIRNPRSGDFDRRGWQHGALYVGLMTWANLPGKGQ